MNTFHLLPSYQLVSHWGFQPAFERHWVVMYSETVARVAEAVHKPKQHLLNVLQLVHIHLEEELRKSHDIQINKLWRKHEGLEVCTCWWVF